MASFRLTRVSCAAMRTSLDVGISRRLLPRRSSSVCVISRSRCLSGSSGSNTPPDPPATRDVYVHPLSQIVLEHLQNTHSSWVERIGLSTGLTFKPDGTFVLRFPRAEDRDSKGKTGETQSASEECGSEENGDNSIWTAYEPEERKHLLCVTRHGLIGRYVLQDNAKPAWHSDKRSTPERVQDAVDEMIGRLEEHRAAEGGR